MNHGGDEPSSFDGIARAQGADDGVVHGVGVLQGDEAGPVAPAPQQRSVDSGGALLHQAAAELRIDPRLRHQACPEMGADLVFDAVDEFVDQRLVDDTLLDQQRVKSLDPKRDW